VITDDVPDGALAVSRPEQKNIEGYAERLKAEESQSDELA
jgi:bifunctional N-acetylglucosamine-1-phosphate-uridyltransferase/glucosamine-1-phosphate-acetyltransferase GlmU-like protein